MAQRPQVPKFGNWENAENVPYTDYFEKARSKKSVKMNPTNPRGNLGTFSDNLPPVQAPPFRMETQSGAHKGHVAMRKKHVHCTSREDGDQWRPSESPRYRDTANWKVASGSPLHRDGSISSNDSPKKAIQQTVGSDRRLEHPNNQARFGSKGRKGSTEGSNNLAPSTPGRSRLRSEYTRGYGTPDHSAVVPKFGDWDEANPTSADGFTRAFNIVREEKLNGNGVVPVAATQNSSKGQTQHQKEMSKSCCCFPFPWSK